MFRKQLTAVAATALAICLGLGVGYGLGLGLGLDASAQADEARPFEGPTQGVGIANKTIGLIDLGPEIEGMEDYNFRMRFWTVEPGGVVPVHSHEGRPAFIYFLKGEIIQTRSDRDEPEVFGPGMVSVENLGVRHYWENKGTETVEMIAVDIVRKPN